MIGKFESHSKLTHGHPLPDHLNPAKQPNGALKDDHAAGPSGAAQPHTNPSPPGSPLPSPMAERAHPRQGPPEGDPVPQDPGVQPERNSSSSGSSSAGDSLGGILALVGGGKFKNWDDIRAGLDRNEENDKLLDKIPFIAAHLDPDKKSPEHAKLNWRKLPDPNHPMFSDFVITQNPQFYSFRRPEQRSAPLAGLPQSPHAAPEPAHSRLGRSHSTPGDFRAPDGPANRPAQAIPASTGPGMTLGDHLARPFTPSPPASPQPPREDSRAGSVSRQSQTPGAGHEANLFPSGAGSEDLDLMNAVIGNPKKWGDLDAGIRKMKEEDARLDKDPFIAAHLDPEKKSPEHGKRTWGKLPAPDHPMFPDFLMTEHPEYYSSCLERRHSAPGGNDPRPAPEENNPPRRTPSLPADMSDREPPIGGIQPLPPNETALRAGESQAGANHPDAAPSENGGPADPRLDELLQENARLRQQAQAGRYKTYLAGVVGAGAGVAAGMIIASATDDSSPKTSP